MRKATGTVKSIRKDGKACCIVVDTETGPNEVWFDLSDAVKPNYVRMGKCEFSYADAGETGNPVLTFIKCEGKGESTYKPYNKPETGFKSQNRFSSETSESMTRMSALKAAGAVYQGSGKEADFKRLTDEIVNYIKGGKFDNAKEFVQKGQLPVAESEDYY